MNKDKAKGEPRRTDKSYEGQAPIANKNGSYIVTPRIRLPKREILRRQREQGAK